jgi:4-cresol dehydrogenase (hydroxylating)
VEFAENLETTNVVPDGIGCFSPLLGSKEPDVVALIQSAGGGSAQQWNQLSRDKNRAVYVMGVTLRGAAKVVQAQAETVKERFGAIKDVQVREGNSWRAPLDLEKIDEPDKGTFGIPTLWRFWPDLAETKDPDWSGHNWFSPNIPQTGEALRKANRVFQQGCQKMGLYWGWSGGIPFFPKTYTLLFAFESGADPATNKKTREGFARMVQIAAENGWSEYRSAPAFYDMIMDVFSFNNHSLRRFCETIKDAVDPDGIVSPGRYGIWPKRLRKERA